MGIQKEKELYLAELLERGALKQDEIDDLDFKTEISAFHSSYLSARFIDNINFGWSAWQAAKAQAVPEGFVLVPKLLSDELADELAIDAFNNIQSMFDYEHRGSTATHREEIRLRWCKNKARDFQENYKAMIEAQEQKG